MGPLFVLNISAWSEKNERQKPGHRRYFELNDLTCHKCYVFVFISFHLIFFSLILPVIDTGMTGHPSGAPGWLEEQTSIYLTQSDGRARCPASNASPLPCNFIIPPKLTAVRCLPGQIVLHTTQGLGSRRRMTAEFYLSPS